MAVDSQETASKFATLLVVRLSVARVAERRLVQSSLMASGQTSRKERHLDLTTRRAHERLPFNVSKTFQPGMVLLGLCVATCRSQQVGWPLSGMEPRADQRCSVTHVKVEEPAASHGARSRQVVGNSSESGDSVELVTQVHQVLYKRNENPGGVTVR